MHNSRLARKIYIKSVGEHSFYICEWAEHLKPSLIQHANNPAVSRFLRNRFPSPYTQESADSFFALLHGSTTFTSYAIVRSSRSSMSSSGRDHHAPDELDEVAVGGIGLTFGDPTDIEAHTAELGYWLGEAFWGQGIMEATVRAFMGEHVEGSVRCDGERPVQLSRVVAVVAAANVGSSRVLEKNGFELEGRLRRYWFKRGEYGDGLQYSKVWP